MQSNDPQSRYYEKHLASKDSLIRELKGYKFFQQYYKRVPELISTEGTIIRFTRVKATNHGDTTMGESLCRDIYPSGFDYAIKHLKKMYEKYAQYRTAAGGTKLFFLDRAALLQVLKLQNDYAHFCNSSTRFAIRSEAVSPDPHLLQKMVTTTEQWKTGLCVPSQGDYHERNLLNGGYIVDFNSAGWNLVSTDIGTFVFHTLFVGNYYGPKYVDFLRDEKIARGYNDDDQLTLRNGTIALRLNAARLKFMRDYLEGYLRVLDLSDEVLVDASRAVTFRLLSKYDPPTMVHRDKEMVYCLANYFYRTNETLLAKLDYLTSGSV